MIRNKKDSCSFKTHSEWNWVDLINKNGSWLTTLSRLYIGQESRKARLSWEAVKQLWRWCKSLVSNKLHPSALLQLQWRANALQQSHLCACGMAKALGLVLTGGEGVLHFTWRKQFLSSPCLIEPSVRNLSMQTLWTRSHAKTWLWAASHSYHLEERLTTSTVVF